MRNWVVIVFLACSSVAAADPPASPRIEALTKKLLAKERGAEDAFWKQVSTEGTPIIEDVKDPKGRLLVTFVYRGKPATKAVSAYDTPSDLPLGHARLARLPNSNVFATSMLVDPRARFSYWFAPGDDAGPPVSSDFTIRRDAWRPDALNKTPYDVRFSLVVLAKAPAQPWLVPKRETPTGELTVHRVKSKALGNERPIAVYTPPGFTKRGAKYPLVVMFDGPEAVMNLALPLVLDELIAAKKIPPCVVLMIGNTDRMKELGLNDAFADHIALDLVPWMRTSYHATSDPRRSVIAGISLGGIAASHAALRHPAVFGNVLSQSGAFQWSPEGVEPNPFARDLAKRPRVPVRFWMEAGTLEAVGLRADANLLTSNRHVRDVLVARGYDVTYSEFVGQHSYVSWRGTLPDGLIALLGSPPKRTAAPPRSPGKPGGVEVDAGRKPIIMLVQRMALLDGGAATVAKLKTLPAELVDEHEVNNATYVLLQLGRARDAVPLYEWNVERFPSSANVYDSLGEAFYQAGERSKALANYKKAFALEPRNQGAKMMIELLSN